MKLSELAEHFAVLDGLTSRNALTGALAELFKASRDPEETRKIVYLLKGALLPPFEAVEIGISEQLMARAIAEATERKIERVKALFWETGDYGSVAERLIGWKGKGISVTQAYDALLRLARTTGKGSIDAKVSGLAALIRQTGPKEARYLLRVPIGKLRLGIGDPTIMDALSYACAADGRLRPVIENAYNLCGDMGRVARVLFRDGVDELRAFKVEVGSPIRMELAERVESVETILKRLGRCSAEPKYDGFRCEVHKDGDKVKVFSRNLENNTEMLPEIVAATREQVKARQAIFEGEAVAYDADTGDFHPFQITVQRKRKHMIEVMRTELPLRLVAFDCLYADGKEMLYEPYVARRRKLNAIIPAANTITVTDAVVSHEPEEIAAFLDRMITAGLEGIIAKDLESPYRAGRRTFDWIKLKRGYQGRLRDTVDCTIVGYFAGRGKRAKWGIGSLLCAVYDPEDDRFETITRVASGLSDEGWKDMKKRLDEARVRRKPRRVVSLYEPDFWVEPTYVTEVLADEITRSPSHTAGRDGGVAGYALRFPRIAVAIRPDRKPEDSTTVEEIKRLYNTQRRSVAAR